MLHFNAIISVFALMLLQVDIPLPDKVWDINPYNALGYGALVLFMVLVNWFTYKTWKESEKYSRERDSKLIDFNSKIVELMIKIEIKLNDSKNLTDQLDDLLDETKDLYAEIRQLKIDLITHINKN